MLLRNPSLPFCLSFLTLFTVLLSGCGKSDIGTIYPVSGRVLQNNEPIKVKSGYIMLKPDTAKGNSTEFLPAGTIDANGNFEVFTKEQSGAPPGWYKVVVTAAGEPPKPVAGSDAGRPVAKSLLAPKYGQEKTTPLSIEVVASPKDGAYDLDVTN